MMAEITYRVDSYTREAVGPIRAPARDLAHAHTLAETSIKNDARYVNIVGVISPTNWWIITTYQPASVAGLHTRPSRD